MCRLVCEDRINELACVVVDELHMVQDRSRGSTVELMLTKLMHAAAHPPMQVIGMSATLPNLDALAGWLGDAALFETDFRPVPLRSHVVVGGVAYPVPERVRSSLIPDV